MRHALVFGSLNVRSLSPLKLDTLLVELRDRSIDVLLLCETWRDRDSVAICRLRADCFSVFERARPRRAPDSLGINHGGVVIAAVPGVRLSVVDVAMAFSRRLLNSSPRESSPAQRPASWPSSTARDPTP